MAGAGHGGMGRVGHYRGGMTTYVLVVAVVAAIGGLLFGFDIVSAHCTVDHAAQLTVPDMNSYSERLEGILKRGHPLPAHGALL